MLTLKECRKLAELNEEKYSDEELNKMLEFLTELASTVVTNLKAQEDDEAGRDNVQSIQ